MEDISRNVRKRGGFTTIELIVSLAIMISIMTAVLANYPESNVRVNLALLAHTITISLREAQLRGSSIESRDLSIGGYGVFFDIGSSTQMAFFNDFATVPGPNNIDIGDSVYATSSTPGLDETESRTFFPYKFKISKICVGNGYPFSGTNGSCNDDQTDGLPIIRTLTISFIRPNPQPIFIINQGDAPNVRSSTSTSAISGACVEISSEAPNRSAYVRSAQAYISGRIITSKIGCQ